MASSHSTATEHATDSATEDCTSTATEHATDTATQDVYYIDDSIRWKEYT